MTAQYGGGAGAGLTVIGTYDQGRIGDINALNCPSGTWTDLFADQALVVPSSKSIYVAVGIAAKIAATANEILQNDALALLVDDATIWPLGGGKGATGTTDTEVIYGMGFFSIGALSVATHQFRVQFHHGSGGIAETFYCRATDTTSGEILRVTFLQ